MANEPSDDEQFRSIVAPFTVNEATNEKLREINKERNEIHAAIDRYSKYLALLLLNDDERTRAHKYLLYLVEQLRHLNLREDTILWEFFKSSHDTSLSVFTARASL